MTTMTMTRPTTTQVREYITIVAVIAMAPRTVDIEYLQEILTRAGAVRAYLIPSDNYIGFEDADGATVAYLPPSYGYIVITTRAADQALMDLPGQPDTSPTMENGTAYDVYLGRRRPTIDNQNVRRPAAKRRRRSFPVFQVAACPSCRAALPTMGVCGRCGTVTTA